MNKKQADDHQNTTLLSNYFIKLCFNGCQWAFYLYLQHNVLHNIKIMEYEMGVTRSKHEEGDKWI